MVVWGTLLACISINKPCVLPARTDTTKGRFVRRISTPETRPSAILALRLQLFFLAFWLFDGRRHKKALQVEALPERRSTTRRQQPAAAAARHLPASQVMAYNQNVRPASDYAENDNTKRRRLSDMVDPLAVRTHHHTPVACVFLGALAALCLIQLLHCSLIASWLRCNRGPFGL